METILQLGAGRFLRAFVDRFVQHAHNTGQPFGRVVIVQSTPGIRANLIAEQPDGFHVVVRGYEDGELVDRVEKVQSVSRALEANGQWSEVIALATKPQLAWIVTNATEAGYALEPTDTLDAAPPSSMPAKLTQLLYQRFQAGAPPLTLLPCELIENNAHKLRELVLTQARGWELSDRFLQWVQRDCLWLNNLVDCIVTPGPSDHPLSASDALLVSAEPYRLWAIQRPADRPSGDRLGLIDHPAIQVVDELSGYYLRKVRILNGLHSAMVGKFLPAGWTTVQEVLQDSAGRRWVRDLLFEEIVPTIAHRAQGVAAFADDTFDRLRNPYLKHRLQDIALNHAAKVETRLRPTRQEYEQLFGRTPPRLAEAMAGEV